MQQSIQMMVGGFHLRPVFLCAVDVQRQARDSLSQNPHTAIDRCHLHRRAFSYLPLRGSGAEQETVGT